MNKNIDYTKLSWRDIHHGAFLSEGRMIAFPTCFPGASTPIIADESRITALAVNSEGDVYGGTSGKATHLFVAMFRGVTGAVFDMGVVKDADHCVAVCCGNRGFIACVNGPKGGQIVAQSLQGLPFDLIQEWGFFRPDFEYLGTAAEGERIVHAVADDSRKTAVGVTDNHLFTIDLDAKRFEIIGNVKGVGKIAANTQGNYFGLDEGDTLWQFNASEKKLNRRQLALPKAAWRKGNLQWAKNPGNGVLYVADDEGRLFAFDEGGGFSECLGQTDLFPIKTMSVTHDGRLFGACGEEMSHIFSYHPGRKEIRDLGIALSTIERRRYGYLFADSVVGSDGEIFFGEDDDLGHLWIYFPKIEMA
ncbi:MAG: hypothetical protein C4527_22575 [Candidatus Omnitrophota bacterium]|jgi:hypothetical protein|nr:MAG: hypothetical protein C4527_22575 [Candidatus Omnitrophota bacterium]